MSVVENILILGDAFPQMVDQSITRQHRQTQLRLSPGNEGGGTFSEEAGMAEMLWGENRWAESKCESLLSTIPSLFGNDKLET